MDIFKEDLSNLVQRWWGLYIVYDCTECSLEHRFSMVQRKVSTNVDGCCKSLLPGGPLMRSTCQDLSSGLLGRTHHEGSRLKELLLGTLNGTVHQDLLLIETICEYHLSGSPEPHLKGLLQALSPSPFIRSFYQDHLWGSLTEASPRPFIETFREDFSLRPPDGTKRPLVLFLVQLKSKGGKWTGGGKLVACKELGVGGWLHAKNWGWEVGCMQRIGGGRLVACKELGVGGWLHAKNWGWEVGCMQRTGVNSNSEAILEDNLEDNLSRDFLYQMSNIHM